METVTKLEKIGKS
ncbi:Protein CBG25326 [Caenorhabditis briggsae]|uniref:Protein CBG25326 n=1 Tax=Caenorhabditis briggsae TaxID=6238 RepID=B6IH24_CAEBR|nr:Protein CBG25326 [Caenorhabditis briggsae]CAR99204.1 Protein CBG25326 [Caenorhabditis briggsae]